MLLPGSTFALRTPKTFDGPDLAAVTLVHVDIRDVSYRWRAPRPGYYWFVALGGGGSGGIAYSNQSHARATGGGAGGLCIKRRFMRAGESVLCDAGGGGASDTSNSTETGQNGNAGEATVLTFEDGLSLNAGGGGAGFQSLTTNTGQAVGGTATGGDINIPGGRSGWIDLTVDQPWADGLGGLGNEGNGGRASIGAFAKAAGGGAPGWHPLIPRSRGGPGFRVDGIATGTKQPNSTDPGAGAGGFAMYQGNGTVFSAAGGRGAIYIYYEGVF